MVMRRMSCPSTPKYSEGVNGSTQRSMSCTTPSCWNTRISSWSSAIARGFGYTSRARSHTYVVRPAWPRRPAATAPEGPKPTTATSYDALTSRGLGDDWIGQRADAFDLDLDRVARFHPY